MAHTFRSSKLYDGYTIAFRQWRAEGTHCRYLHGYGVSFRVTFRGELDSNNWVYDFGGLKRSKHLIDGMPPQVWLDWLLDHTTIIAEDDPALEHFQNLDREGVLQLRVLKAVGTERIAEYLYNTFSRFITEETRGRVQVTRVDFYENDRNYASFGEDNT